MLTHGSAACLQALTNLPLDTVEQLAHSHPPTRDWEAQPIPDAQREAPPGTPAPTTASRPARCHRVRQRRPRRRPALGGIGTQPARHNECCESRIATLAVAGRAVVASGSIIRATSRHGSRPRRLRLASIASVAGAVTGPTSDRAAWTTAGGAALPTRSDTKSTERRFASGITGARSVSRRSIAVQRARASALVAASAPSTSSSSAAANLDAAAAIFANNARLLAAVFAPSSSPSRPGWPGATPAAAPPARRCWPRSTPSWSSGSPSTRSWSARPSAPTAAG